MNFHTYGTHYGKFHGYTISSVKENILIFNFGTSPYETWFLTRMNPPENVFIDSNKPFLQALKAFFKSDVPASVVCNEKYLWTICLGSDRVVYSIDKELKTKENVFRLYSTPYFVERIHVVNQYLQGMIRPVYENVFFYKNTVLYLDNEDAPYPGGNYFKKRDPISYYRICFLSNEPVEHVLKLAAEWKARQGILFIPYLTRDVVAVPKFIDFKPVSESGFSDANISSTGVIYKKFSSKKPEHLIQDILTSYYTNISRREYGKVPEFNFLGLFIEWPFLLTFEGARHTENRNENRQFVALSINGTQPSRVLHVCRPYERYVEYNDVPATLWTPISFVLSTLPMGISLRKVVIDTVVVGVVYRDTFFCLDQPLFEGYPTPHKVLNGKYILSTATFEINEDINIRVNQTFRLNEHYSLRRVNLKGLSLDAWCLTKSSQTDPFPKNVRLPDLVKMWVDFFTEVGERTLDINISAVRLALMLSKHNLCFHLNAVENNAKPMMVSDDRVNFFFHEKIVQFINDIRMLREEEESQTTKTCVVS